MSKLPVFAIAFVIWSVVAGAIGWCLRDGRADAATATQAVSVEAARADHVTEARADDHATQQAAAVVEQQRVDKTADNESNFKIIERTVIKYVQANPDTAVCDLDGDGLRAWRAANAGSVDDAEPVDTGGAVGHPSR